MKKVLILILLILLSACQTTPTATEATYCPPDCAEGSSSLDIEINSPTETIYTDGRTLVSVHLENTGEASIEEGSLCITGLDSEIFE